MWHEARKQEKKLRGMIVDFKKRAERRREFYEKFKADPAQFMQIHGRRTKIHMDAQISQQAESCLMPWNENKDIMIDRFDVRAHLDYIPEVEGSKKEKDVPPEFIHNYGPKLPGNESSLKISESQLNYERYRILIQSEALGTTEEKFLQQIKIEEQYGATGGVRNNQSASINSGKQSKKASKNVAAFNYNYDDSTPSAGTLSSVLEFEEPEKDLDEDLDDEDLEEVDFDLIVTEGDIMKKDAELNVVGEKFTLGPGDFMKFFNNEMMEKEKMKLAKLQEEEQKKLRKQQEANLPGGRKANRRSYRSLRNQFRSNLPPLPTSTTFPQEDFNGNTKNGGSAESPDRKSSSSSSEEQITFITSFEGVSSTTGGGEGEIGVPYEHKDKDNDHTNESDKKEKKLENYPRYYGRKEEDTSYRSRRKRSTSTSSSSDYSRHRSRDRRRGRSSSSSSERRYSRRHSRSRSYSRRSSSYSSYSRSSRSRTRSRSRSRRSYSSSSRSYSTRSRSHSRSSSSDRSRKRKWSSSSSRSRSRSSRSSNSRSRSRGREKDRERKKIVGDKDKKVGDEAMDINEINNSDTPVQVPSSSFFARPIKKTKDPKLYPIKIIKPTFASISLNNDSGASTTTATTAGSSPASTSTPSLTPQEKLKKRMQSALSKQLNKDKEAEKERLQRLETERIEREESLRELSIKYRKREREKRHKQTSHDDDGHDTTPSPMRIIDDDDINNILQRSRRHRHSSNTSSSKSSSASDVEEKAVAEIKKKKKKKSKKKKSKKSKSKNKHKSKSPTAVKKKSLKLKSKSRSKSEDSD